MFGRPMSESKIVKILERRIESLEKREDALLNRIMARDYGEFVLGQDVLKNEEVDVVPYPEDSLEESAGTMIATES